MERFEDRAEDRRIRKTKKALRAALVKLLPRGDFYKNMFTKCPAGRPGTADEVANVAELLMSDRGAFITGADFLIDGGATASYFYGPLKP